MSELQTRCLAYGSFGVRVAGDAGSLGWLEEFFTPSFEAREAASTDWNVVLTGDDRLYEALLSGGPEGDGAEMDCFALDRGLVRLPVWRSPGDERVLFDGRFRVFYRVAPHRASVQIVTPETNRRCRFALMRVVRELAMSSIEAQGRMLLHASAFTVNGRGTLIAGPKEVGKTTLLMAALQNDGAEFVANDRVVVDVDATPPVLRGMPTLVTIRAAALAFFPRLERTLRQEPFSHWESLRERSSRPPTRPGAPIDVTPAQLCDALRVPMSAGGIVHAVLFPRVTGRAGGISLREIGPDAARERLASCLLGAAGRSELFTPQASTENRLGRADLCDALAARVRCFECELGSKAYDQARSTLELLGHTSPSLPLDWSSSSG